MFPYFHREYPRPFIPQPVPGKRADKSSFFDGLVVGMVIGGVLVFAGMIYALTHTVSKTLPVPDVAPAAEQQLVEPKLPCEPAGEMA